MLYYTPVHANLPKHVMLREYIMIKKAMIVSSIHAFYCEMVHVENYLHANDKNLQRRNGWKHIHDIAT